MFRLSSVFFGPFTSSEKFLESFGNVKFAGGGGDFFSFGVEGLAQALFVLVTFAYYVTRGDVIF